LTIGLKSTCGSYSSGFSVALPSSSATASLGVWNAELKKGFAGGALIPPVNAFVADVGPPNREPPGAEAAKSPNEGIGFAPNNPVAGLEGEVLEPACFAEKSSGGCEGALAPNENGDTAGASSAFFIPKLKGFCGEVCLAGCRPNENWFVVVVVDSGLVGAGSVAPGFKVEQHAHLMMSFLLGA